ncbi:MAG: hypothetical protein JXA22_00930 [Candidatus Thermoplasmatota archaeon]|nr:hypothetical protein [Candidatus Thermoplasmatota archaeon]
METYWIIPIHVRPVISYNAIMDGRITGPSSGMDRFNLTEVGDLILGHFRDNGAEMRLKNVEPPFPWEMIFRMDGEAKASLLGLKVGPSTFRSIFKLLHTGEPGVVSIISDSLSSLGRDPLDSPYWGDAEWQSFQKMYRLTRDRIASDNSSLWSLPGSELHVHPGLCE